MERNTLEVWFVTGSQDLYGEATLPPGSREQPPSGRGTGRFRSVAGPVVFKPVVTTPEAILQVCREATAAANCIGVVAWMHTFSPAKMWIAGSQSARQAARRICIRNSIAISPGRRSTWIS